MFVDGVWQTNVESTTDADGPYDRAETSFRDRIRDEPGARFQPAADRYHLCVARNCPWAHGVALVRRLAGLTDAITLDVVDEPCICPDWQQRSPEGGCKHLRRVDTGIKLGRVPRPDGRLPTTSA